MHAVSGPAREWEVQYLLLKRKWAELDALKGFLRNGNFEIDFARSSQGGHCVERGGTVRNRRHSALIPFACGVDMYSVDQLHTCLVLLGTPIFQ